MIKTLAKGYGLGTLAGLACAAIFDLSIWQTFALIWIGSAPLTLLLRPLPMPRVPRLARLLPGRTTRTQSAGY